MTATVPNYVAYQGFSWRTRLEGDFVTLFIIGFQNQHTQRLPLAEVLAKLQSGEMRAD